MLNSLLERLLNNLQETHKVYTRLLEVAERKQNHILNHETENLKADLKVEEGLAGAGTGLNAEREGVAPCSTSAKAATPWKSFAVSCPISGGSVSSSSARTCGRPWNGSTA